MNYVDNAWEAPECCECTFEEVHTMHWEQASERWLAQLEALGYDMSVLYYKAACREFLAGTTPAEYMD